MEGADAPPAHERAVVRTAILVALPGVVATLVLLWRGSYTPGVRWTVAIAVVLASLLGVVVLRERVVRPLQTLANILAALREGDFSIRARGAERDDALRLVFSELNLLGETLRSQRLGAMEATALLQAVMAEIDVAIFAFDEERRLRLVNRAGERLLDRPAERMLGGTAEEIGLGEIAKGSTPRTLDMAFPGGTGRWAIRRGSFRQEGRPHTLLVLADVTKALREEELQAWRRIVRVLSHEINNSLAPIRSISGTLQDVVARLSVPDEAREDLRGGLEVIGSRSDALVRFMSAYARLARLPQPNRAPLDVSAWVHRVTQLETRLPVRVVDGPPTTICADADQLEQLLINLVRNAADASLETGGGATVQWERVDGAVIVAVQDDGPGLPPRANLFVPFFTTKPQGSGIGLVLCQQIAEAHGGAVELENRTEGRGCVARVRLPIEG